MNFYYRNTRTRHMEIFLGFVVFTINKSVVSQGLPDPKSFLNLRAFIYDPA